MSLEISGFDKINNNIKQLIRNIEGAESKVVLAGAKVQYQAVKENIFVDTGRARDQMVIGKPYKQNGETFFNIGWPEDSKVAYRVHFAEWGTVHQPPQLKVTKAQKASQSAARQAMINVIRREYNIHG